MSAGSKNSVPMVKVSEREIELFEQRAPGALSRRGKTFFLHELSHGFNILLLGFVPIIGMSCFGWSSKFWLLFLWINLWAGILFDTIRYLFLKNQIKKYIKTCFEDDFVWVIADALKAGKKEVPQQHLKGGYSPLTGLVFDLVFGGVSTLMISGQYFFDEQDSLRNAFSDSSFIFATVGMLIWRLVSMIWQIVDADPGDETGANVKILLGGRGAAMFMLFFLLVVSTGSNATLMPFYVFNGFIVVIALLNFYGMATMAPTSIWLRKYLEAKEPGSH